jgi:hypothetical protein
MDKTKFKAQSWCYIAREIKSWFISEFEILIFILFVYKILMNE